MLDATRDRHFRLTAQKGKTDFTGLGGGETWGFNQSFLGPTLRLPARSFDASTDRQYAVRENLGALARYADTRRS